MSPPTCCMAVLLGSFAFCHVPPKHSWEARCQQQWSVSSHSPAPVCHSRPLSSIVPAEVLKLQQDPNLLQAPNDDDSVCWAQWLRVGPEVGLSVGFQALLMVWSGLPF